MIVLEPRRASPRICKFQLNHNFYHVSFSSAVSAPPSPPTMPRNEVRLASDAPCPGPQVRRGRPPRAAAQPPSNLFIPLHNVYYILLYAPNVVHSKNISATVPAFPAMPHGNMKVKHLSHLIPVRHRGKRWHRCGNNFSFRPDPSPK